MQTLTNGNNYGATLAQAEEHLRNLEPFHTGTLSGEWRREGVYAVQSYGVTIALWKGTALEANDAFVAPDAYDYSATTSKHANIVKRAWGLN